VRNCGGSTLTFWNSVAGDRFFQHVGWSGKLWTKQSRSGWFNPRLKSSLVGKTLRSLVRKPLDLWSESPWNSGRKVFGSPVGKVSESPVGKVSESPVGKVFESPVGKVSESPVGKVLNLRLEKSLNLRLGSPQKSISYVTILTNSP